MADSTAKKGSEPCASEPPQQQPQQQTVGKTPRLKSMEDPAAVAQPQLANKTPRPRAAGTSPAPSAPPAKAPRTRPAAAAGAAQAPASKPMNRRAESCETARTLTQSGSASKTPRRKSVEGSAAATATGGSGGSKQHAACGASKLSEVADKQQSPADATSKTARPTPRPKAPAEAAAGSIDVAADNGTPLLTERKSSTTSAASIADIAQMLISQHRDSGTHHQRVPTEVDYLKLQQKYLHLNKNFGELKAAYTKTVHLLAALHDQYQAERQSLLDARKSLKAELKAEIKKKDKKLAALATQKTGLEEQLGQSDDRLKQADEQLRKESEARGELQARLSALQDTLTVCKDNEAFLVKLQKELEVENSERRLEVGELRFQAEILQEALFHLRQALQATTGGEQPDAQQAASSGELEGKVEEGKEGEEEVDEVEEYWRRSDRCREQQQQCMQQPQQLMSAPAPAAGRGSSGRNRSTTNSSGAPRHRASCDGRPSSSSATPIALASAPATSPKAPSGLHMVVSKAKSVAQDPPRVSRRRMADSFLPVEEPSVIGGGGAATGCLSGPQAKTVKA